MSDPLLTVLVGSATAGHEESSMAKKGTGMLGFLGLGVAVWGIAQRFEADTLRKELARERDMRARAEAENARLQQQHATNLALKDGEIQKLHGDIAALEKRLTPPKT